VIALGAAQAAYLWRLQSERVEIDRRLADLDLAFRLLLQLQTGEQTAALLRARAAYVAELAEAGLDFEAQIADLATIHQRLISAALDQAAARGIADRNSAALNRGYPAGSSRRRVRLEEVIE
jgi:hypothetical protein